MTTGRANVEAWTVGRLLKWTTDYLKQHESDSPRLDAEVLLAHARGCERIELYTAYDTVCDEAHRARFRELVKQRAEGQPVAYLVAHREFYSLDFDVTPDVLIPRSETEFLVIAAVDRGRQLLVERGGGEPLRILDVGTGSGVVAVCLARELGDARLTAVDVSAEALRVARGNALRHGVEPRIEWVRSDLLDALPADAGWDLIVSNPPYVSQSEYEALPRAVRQEPRGALLAGPDGCEVIRRLVPQAADRITPGGWLLLEISPMIADRVGELIQATGEFEEPQRVKDLAGHVRVLAARRR